MLSVAKISPTRAGFATEIHGNTRKNTTTLFIFPCFPCFPWPKFPQSKLVLPRKHTETHGRTREHSSFPVLSVLSVAKLPPAKAGFATETHGNTRKNTGTFFIFPCFPCFPWPKSSQQKLVLPRKHTEEHGKIFDFSMLFVLSVAKIPRTKHSVTRKTSFIFPCPSVCFRGQNSHKPAS